MSNIDGPLKPAGHKEPEVDNSLMQSTQTEVVAHVTSLGEPWTQYRSQHGTQPTPRKKEKHTMEMLKKFWSDEDGLTTVEYALLLALIVVVAITAWTALGTGVNSTVDDVQNTLP
jgi:pilus assembly protein Flp/PilA